MAGYNRIIIMGNLTKDPELKALGTQSVCKLTLASNRSYKNRQTGMLVQEVCFIDVDVWGAQAENCKTYLQKGRPVLVEGRLKQDTWKDAEGNTRSKHGVVAESIVFLQSGQAQLDESIQDQASSLADEMGMTQDTFAAATVNPTSANKKKSTNNFKDQPPFEEDLPF